MGVLQIISIFVCFNIGNMWCSIIIRLNFNNDHISPNKWHEATPPNDLLGFNRWLKQKKRGKNRKKVCAYIIFCSVRWSVYKRCYRTGSEGNVMQDHVLRSSRLIGTDVKPPARKRTAGRRNGVYWTDGIYIRCNTLFFSSSVDLFALEFF